MANDLSTPLTGRKRKPGTRPHFPLARVLFAILVLIGAGFALRVLLTDDPNGGRPSQEVAITSVRGQNELANELSTGPVTITADPQEYPVDGAEAAPPGTSGTGAIAGLPDVFGALPDLSEETSNGSIPRIAATGLTPFAAYAAPISGAAAAGGPRIAVIVTGLGINEQGSLEAIESLPESVTLAFAPYGKTLSNTVSAARMAGHEVMLEIPLEPFDYPQNDPGPQTLLTGETPRANLDKLFWLMSRFGGYTGVINNMGARFTASAQDFAPIMEELGARGLGYIDDGSSNRSLAPQLAQGNKVPFSRSDLVIDANPSRQAILAALASLEAKALENGQAIGIVSALPISMAAISEWSRDLETKGISLVPASALMK
ncbi:MAG: divergent polysaccharide deacetylase family protein [Candidatus Devosia phytovorans]|uniref:Divergent polysaccharide deacetylase family protein n=1 Tax=Candidatus Devosia phytovorans TaxID=3121372 RepID=A0AAJ5VUE8_9HYPH|nr:divergent polysaccharide deacetylase family protein [Devosia sp.]WEK04336.1 MAG: divergent polysaccharide deacetylase family protein [Devosia sp.]